MSSSTNDDLQMTFWEHLEELRSRILKALIAFATEVVSAADNPKQLIKTLSGVDSYVDKVTKALS